MSSTSSPSPIPDILLLCDQERFIDAFSDARAAHLSNTPIKISILHERLNTVPADTRFDAIVSPANSYGRLDGGFDDAISRAFTQQGDYHAVTRAAQSVLYTQWRGYAPPGTCTLAPMPPNASAESASTLRWGCRYLALCPTMRTPEDVRWNREIVYNCVWSLLVAVERLNKGLDEEERERGLGIRTILITPLATGYGMVSPQKWAQQFCLAIKHFVDAVARPERWGNLSWADVLSEVNEVENTYSL